MNELPLVGLDVPKDAVEVLKDALLCSGFRLPGLRVTWSVVGQHAVEPGSPPAIDALRLARFMRETGR